jgi:hypothetical protein
MGGGSPIWQEIQKNHRMPKMAVVDRLSRLNKPTQSHSYLARLIGFGSRGQAEPWQHSNCSRLRLRFFQKRWVVKLALVRGFKFNTGDRSVVCVLPWCLCLI